jgi:hypothetical protein
LEDGVARAAWARLKGRSAWSALQEGVEALPGHEWEDLCRIANRLSDLLGGNRLEHWDRKVYPLMVAGLVELSSDQRFKARFVLSDSRTTTDHLAMLVPVLGPGYELLGQALSDIEPPLLAPASAAALRESLNLTAREQHRLPTRMTGEDARASLRALVDALPERWLPTGPSDWFRRIVRGFDEAPCREGLFTQTHRATLGNGLKVEVELLKPDAMAALQRNLTAMGAGAPAWSEGSRLLERVKRDAATQHHLGAKAARLAQAPKGQEARRPIEGLCSPGVLVTVVAKEPLHVEALLADMHRADAAAIATRRDRSAALATDAANAAKAAQEATSLLDGGGPDAARALRTALRWFAQAANAAAEASRGLASLATEGSEERAAATRAANRHGAEAAWGRALWHEAFVLEKAASALRGSSRGPGAPFSDEPFSDEPRARRALLSAAAPSPWLAATKAQLDQRQQDVRRTAAAAVEGARVEHQQFLERALARPMEGLRGSYQAFLSFASEVGVRVEAAADTVSGQWQVERLLAESVLLPAREGASRQSAVALRVEQSRFGRRVGDVDRHGRTGADRQLAEDGLSAWFTLLNEEWRDIARMQRTLAGRIAGLREHHAERGFYDGAAGAHLFDAGVRYLTHRAGTLRRDDD